MALVRLEPFGLNRLFDEVLSRASGKGWDETGSTVGFVPPLDIYEDQEGLSVSVDLPGIDPKSVELHVDNSVLTLKGERKQDHEDRQENYLRVERSYGSFTRSFSLPATVDADKCMAEFKNGVLLIHLARKESAKPRQIKVKTE